ncbi:MAG: orotidine-5'-phosphate decarboxylase [Pseudomonadales bacterium]
MTPRNSITRITRNPFIDQLRFGWESRESLLCVGLDPDLERLPASYREREREHHDGLLRFCCDIVDSTAGLVCAFKPQIAYFAALGRENQLAELIAYIHERHPEHPVILDAKRGDIGATARLYAREAFERYDADAVTVNAYLGEESLAPFIEYRDRGVIVLCRTSNPDSAWLQNHPAEDPTYLRIARGVREWNRHGNLLLVAGATYADDIGRIREVVADMPLLVPGIGAQGGDLASVMAAGCDRRGQGLIISASRSILFADTGSPMEGARRAAAALRDEMRRLQKEIAPDRTVV